MVSVVTPTKNRVSLLCEAMDSVQRQDFEPWEHIVVDDGSNDGTEEEVVRRSVIDPRVRYLKADPESKGANACRNRAVRESRAGLIVFLDSDDLLGRGCLARRVSIMQRNADIDFATFQTAVFSSTPGDLRRQFDDELHGDDLLRFLFFECPWVISGPIWRKESLLRLDLFDEMLPSWQDIDLHVRAIASGCRYLRFPDVDHHVRWQFEPTKVSIRQRRSPLHLEAATSLLKKFDRIVSEGPGMNWSRQRALCSLYFFIAERWLEAGDLSLALRSWSHIREKPLGSRVLHISGAALLGLQALDSPGRRIGSRLTHKWKGWVRMRSNPELVNS